jgi:predicted transcriptional regulator
MAEDVTLSARITGDLDARLARLAELTDRSRFWHVTQALERYLEQELAFALAVAEGIAAADRGELIPHEELMDELEHEIGTIPA